MSLRLSPALFGLALLAAALALFAPAGQGAARAGLAAGALALALWRRSTARRLRSPADAHVPPPAVLDAAVRTELGAKVRQQADRAASREEALDGIARLLRAELGLHAVRVFAVRRIDAREARLAELIDAEAGLHAAERRVGLDATPHGPALHSGRRHGDAREVMVVPLPAGGPPQVLIELTGMALSADAVALDGVLAAVERALQPWFGSGDPAAPKPPILSGAEDNAADAASAPGSGWPAAGATPRLSVPDHPADR